MYGIPAVFFFLLTENFLSDSNFSGYVFMPSFTFFIQLEIL